MTSIRTYEGEIRLCRSCGQPCYYGEVEVGMVWQHFREQWDGVYCPHHPFAGKTVAIEWDDMSLQTLKEEYRDTYPRG